MTNKQKRRKKKAETVEKYAKRRRKLARKRRYCAGISICKIQQTIGPHEDLPIVKRRKLQRYGHVSRSSGLPKTVLQGTVKGGKKTRQTEKEVGRQHQGMVRPGERQVPEGS